MQLHVLWLRRPLREWEVAWLLLPSQPQGFQWRSGERQDVCYFPKNPEDNYLDKLGFNLVGYGCTTCIGNSGPLDDNIVEAIKEKNLYGVSVLSGNRNFGV